MIFKWFDAGACEKFGETLAGFYSQRIPPDAKLTPKQFAAKTDEVLKKMDLQLLQFRQSNVLNFYKTARLGNGFKWALKEAGYDDAYIDRLTAWLVGRL